MVDTVVDVMLNAGLRSEPIQTLFHRLQRRNPDSPCGLGQQKKNKYMKNHLAMKVLDAR